MEVSIVLDGNLLSLLSSENDVNLFLTLNRSVDTPPLLHNSLRASRCRCRRIFLPILVFVVVRVITHALDHNRGNVIPRTRTLHLKPNHTFQLGDSVAVLSTLHHLITACHTAKV